MALPIVFCTLSTLSFTSLHVTFFVHFKCHKDIRVLRNETVLERPAKH